MSRLFLCTLSFVVMCHTPITLADDAKPQTMNEIPMDPKHIEAASADLPAKAMAIDSSDNIWFIGHHFLWKWTPSKNSLQQIKLLTEDTLKQMAISGDEVLVSDHKRIFQIQIEPFKVHSVSSSNQESESLALLADQDFIYWVKTDGIYEFSKDTHSLRKIFEHSLEESEESKFLFIAQTKTLWMTRARELSYISYGENKKSKKIGKIEKNIQDIQRVQDDVYALSPYAVFRYTKRGKLIQTIPVHADRRIVLSSLLPDTHLYVFQDRLLEMHLPSEKKTFHYVLNIGRVHKATTMHLRNSYLGLILDGIPRIFQFSNDALARRSNGDAAPL